MDIRAEFEAWWSWAQMWLLTISEQLQSIAFLLQIVAVAASGLFAYLLVHSLGRLSKKLLASVLSHRIVVLVSSVVGAIAVPAIWLFFLWMLTEVVRSSGFANAVMGAGVSLLTAWIVIRLLTMVVRHELWSGVIFFSVYSLAALDILGVLERVQTALAGTGFTYGEIRITALNVVHALVVLGILLWVLALVRGFLERRIMSAANLTPSLQALVIQILKLAFPVIAFLLVLPVLGVSLTALTVFGGAAVIGVGLGLQRLIANLLSGLTLLGSGTIRPGDVIALADVEGSKIYGRVREITMRYTALRTRDGIEHIVPNEQFIANTIEKWSHSDDKIRLKIPFGISYDAKPREAIAIALEAAAEVTRVLDDPAPVCLLKGFGDSSVDLELRIWINDPMNGISNVKNECLLGIWDRLHEAGIGIPYPQRDIHVRSLPEGFGAKSGD
jgi:small-conductance mechanosensitive channel